MIVRIDPAPLRGEVTLPPSKSVAHRALICAALSRGACRLSPCGRSDDIIATVGGLEALGADTAFDGDDVIINGHDLFHKGSRRIDCHASGSTLRFLIPVAALSANDTTFTGRDRLPERPLDIYHDTLPAHGVRMMGPKDKDGKFLPLTVKGPLRSGQYILPGDVSSQFVSGLLLALPLCGGPSEIVLTTPLESAGYVDMTVRIMSDFGVKVTATERGFQIAGNQSYQPRDYIVEGDWSHAAFFLEASALHPGSSVELTNVSSRSIQGDSAADELFRAFGKPLKGISIDASQVPDLVPALAVTAAFAEGETMIHSAARLRLKECDRLSAVAEGLGQLGIRVEERPDGLVIQGGRPTGGTVKGYRDHRIVMAFAMGATAAAGPVTITDAEAVNKSYPSFFEDIKRLGAVVHVV